MRTLILTIAAIALVVMTAAPRAQQPRIAAAAAAMGAANLTSLQYAGTGFVYSFGQAYLPGERWPQFVQRVYSAAIDYRTPAMRLEQARSQSEMPPHGGGGQPIAGEATTVQVVSGKYAWSEGGAQPAPNPGAVGDRLRQLWTTPHGVIKAAMANGGSVAGNIITVTIEGRMVTATLNERNLVERVSYLSTNETAGDYPIEIAYSDYAAFGGIQFPTHIVQTEEGHPTLDIRVYAVTPNAAVSLAPPANVVQAPPPPAGIAVQMDALAPHVWYVTAAGNHSWAVEFTDYVVAVEAIGSDARSLAVNEEIRKKIPSKPIRYVINTHAHYDHAGGLRTYVAQGATVVTHELNRAFYERTWARPRTIDPDTLSKQPKAPVFETVTDKKVLTDGSMTIEVYHLKNTGHHGGNLLVYMPQEQLVFWGDGYNPPAGDDPRDLGRTPEYALDLYRFITMNNLVVKTVAPAHGVRPRSYDDFKRAIGLLPLR